MKRNIIFVLLLLLSCVYVMAADNIDLEQEYRKLDKAIEMTDRYVQERENRIHKYKTALEVTDDNKVQYEMCRHLYDEYKPYMSDSAIHYIGRCIVLAERLNNPIRVIGISMYRVGHVSRGNGYFEFH